MDQNQAEENEKTSEVINLGPDVIDKTHFFVQKRDNDGQMVAQCTKCPLGYPLGTEQVKNGHIYIRGQLVI